MKVSLVKKVISIVLCFLFAFCIFPANIYAEDNITAEMSLYNKTEDAAVHTSTEYKNINYLWAKDEDTVDVFRIMININFPAVAAKDSVTIKVRDFNQFCKPGMSIHAEPFVTGAESFRIVREDVDENNIPVTVIQNTVDVTGDVVICLEYDVLPSKINELASGNIFYTVECSDKSSVSEPVFFESEFYGYWEINLIDTAEIREDALDIHPEQISGINKNDYYWVTYKLELSNTDDIELYDPYIKVEANSDAGYNEDFILYSAVLDFENFLNTNAEIYNLPVNKDAPGCYYIKCDHCDDEPLSYLYVTAGIKKDVSNNANALKFTAYTKRYSSSDVYGEGLDSNFVYAQPQIASAQLSGNYRTQTPSNYRSISAFDISKDSLQEWNYDGKFYEYNGFTTAADVEMTIESEAPFLSYDTVNESTTKTVVDESKYRINSVTVPGFYYNANGEQVYGVGYRIEAFGYDAGSNEHQTYIFEDTITENRNITFSNNIKSVKITYWALLNGYKTPFYTVAQQARETTISPEIHYALNVTESEIDGTPYDCNFVCFPATFSNDGTNFYKARNYVKIAPKKVMFSQQSLTSKIKTAYSNSLSLINESVKYMIETNSWNNEKLSDFTAHVMLPYPSIGNNSIDTIVNSAVVKTLSPSDEDYVTVNPENYTITGSITPVQNGMIVHLNLVFEDGREFIAIPNATFLTLDFDWTFETSMSAERSLDVLSAVYVNGANYSDNPVAVNYLFADDGSAEGLTEFLTFGISSISDIDRDGDVSEGFSFKSSILSFSHSYQTGQNITILIRDDDTPNADFVPAYSTDSAVVLRQNGNYTVRILYTNNSPGCTSLKLYSDLGFTPVSNASEWNPVNNYNTLSKTATGVPSEGSFSYETSSLSAGVPTKNNEIPVVVYEWTATGDETLSEGQIITCDMALQVPSDAAGYTCIGASSKAYIEALHEETTAVASDNVYALVASTGTISYTKVINTKDINYAHGVPVFIAEIVYNNGSETKTISQEYVFDDINNAPVVDVSDGNNIPADEFSGVVKKKVGLLNKEYWQITFVWDNLPLGNYTVKELYPVRYKGYTLYDSDDTLGITNKNLDIPIEENGNPYSFSLTIADSQADFISTSFTKYHKDLGHEAICVNKFENVTVNNWTKDNRVYVINNGDVLDVFEFDISNANTSYTLPHINADGFVGWMDEKNVVHSSFDTIIISDVLIENSDTHEIMNKNPVLRAVYEG